MMGMGIVPILAIIAGILVALPSGNEGFIKAAIGLRIGYSPSEKGYGQPPQIAGLHSKTPAVKGQFITGVQGQPQHGHGHNDHNGGPPKGTHGHPPLAPQSGLLRHLKVLGVNLYLGGPKAPLHQVKGTEQFRTAEELRHFRQGSGPRGQYSPGQGNEGFRVIEGQNEIHQNGHNPNEIFDHSATQYYPPGPPRFPPQFAGGQESAPNQRPSGPPQQGFSQHAPQGYNGNHNHGPHAQHGPSAAPPTGGPPRQGFSLASLMSGPQWAPRGILPMFRIPLMLPFMPRPGPPPSHAPINNHGHAHNQHNQGFPHGHAHNGHQQQQFQSPQAAHSQPQLQYSTLYSTNSRNPLLAVPSAQNPMTMAMPHHQHQHHSGPVSMQMQMQGSASGFTQFGSNQQRPGHSPGRQPPPAFPPYRKQQPIYPIAQFQPQPPPQHQREGIRLVQGQSQNQGPFSHPQMHHASPPAAPVPAASSSSYFPQPQAQPQFFSSPYQYQHQQPPPQHSFQRPEQFQHQQGPEFSPGSDQHQGQSQNYGRDERESFRAPDGFQYSHTDSEPLVSMGMTSYDDPPVMMDEGHGHGGQGSGVEGSPAHGHGHGQEERMFGKEITEDEYNQFLRQGQEQGQGRHFHPERRISDNGHGHRIGVVSDVALKTQASAPKTRSLSLNSSLLKWNPLLDRYQGGQIASPVRDLAGSGTELVSSTVPTTTVKVTTTTVNTTPEKSKTEVQKLRIKRPEAGSAEVTGKSEKKQLRIRRTTTVSATTTTAA